MTKTMAMSVATEWKKSWGQGNERPLTASFKKRLWSSYALYLNIQPTDRITVFGPRKKIKHEFFHEIISLKLFSGLQYISSLSIYPLKNQASKQSIQKPNLPTETFFRFPQPQSRGSQSEPTKASLFIPCSSNSPWFEPLYTAHPRCSLQPRRRSNRAPCFGFQNSQSNASAA